MKTFLWSIALAAIATSARAQVPPRSERSAFPEQLSLRTRSELARVADSAAVLGLPRDALVAKASEGVLKGADEARIVRAVRLLVQELSLARAVLPTGVATGTLTAAASALHSGVAPDALRRVVAAGASSAESDLALAFVTLADLSASRVSADRAGRAVEQLLARHAPASDMVAFREAVVQDIVAGRTPDEALASQVRIFVRPGPSDPSDRAPVKRPDPD